VHVFLLITSTKV